MSNISSTKNIAYQLPPDEIVELIDAKPTPGLIIHPNGKMMLIFGKNNLPSLKFVAQDELRLAGHRFNPNNYGPSRAAYYNSIEIRDIEGNHLNYISNLPKNAKIRNLGWSPNAKYFTFTLTFDYGIQLWVLDVEKGQARPISEANINCVYSGNPYHWFSDSEHIIYKTIDQSQEKIEKPQIPFGPIIQENFDNRSAHRTYQDLLKSEYDEKIFDYFLNAQLVIQNINTGNAKPFHKPGIFKAFSSSPNGDYILLSTLKKPYSYTLPSNRFPFSIDLCDRNGTHLKQLENVPLLDDMPINFGAVRKGKRNFGWRPDKPATLYWVVAQDEGNPKKDVAIRDIAYSLDAPFKSDAKPFAQFKLRYGGFDWCKNNIALTYEWWWPQRQIITSIISPSKGFDSKKILFDRSWEDIYNDPGTFQKTRNEYGRQILLYEAKTDSLFLFGQGASPRGNEPFLDAFDIKNKIKKRVWQSQAPFYESAVKILDSEAGTFITRRESQTDQPNYFLRNWNNNKLQQVSFFEKKFESIENLQKELVRYQRKDGIELIGTLYLPKGYNPKNDGPLPLFLWAYPKEYKSADAAGQVAKSPYEYTKVNWSSASLWATQGFAVLNDFSMPIIGENNEEPNENFIEQLISGAEAAIENLTNRGIAQRGKIAVGGHSYGAFMTANLLAHTNLFAAGIARSGAFNRTLTPFGFQSEERTFWEASETYFKMSPFMHANKIKAPLLLIHGEADNNSGTYPMQSERFYNALKGHGANTRLVILPHESHSYRARASVMHVLWEMHQWLQRFVK